jgi:hypothetical protein
MFVYHPKRRITAQAALEHPYITGIPAPPPSTQILPKTTPIHSSQANDLNPFTSPEPTVNRTMLGNSSSMLKQEYLSHPLMNMSSSVSMTSSSMNPMGDMSTASAIPLVMSGGIHSAHTGTGGGIDTIPLHMDDDIDVLGLLDMDTHDVPILPDDEDIDMLMAKDAAESVCMRILSEDYADQGSILAVSTAPPAVAICGRNTRKSKGSSLQPESIQVVEEAPVAPGRRGRKPKATPVANDDNGGSNTLSSTCTTANSVANIAIVPEPVAPTSTSVIKKAMPGRKRKFLSPSPPCASPQKSNEKEKEVDEERMLNSRPNAMGTKAVDTSVEEKRSVDTVPVAVAEKEIEEGSCGVQENNYTTTIPRTRSRKSKSLDIPQDKKEQEESRMVVPSRESFSAVITEGTSNRRATRRSSTGGNHVAQEPAREIAAVEEAVSAVTATTRSTRSSKTRTT